MVTTALKRFSDEEKECVRQMYVANEAWSEIRMALRNKFGKLRSVGTLRGLIHKHKWARDRRKQQLINRYGPAPTLDELLARREAVRSEGTRNLEAERDERRRSSEEALRVLAEQLRAGVPRHLAFRSAMDGGATLQQIADLVFLTRERVRQILIGDLRSRVTILKFLAKLTPAQQQELLAEAARYKEVLL